MDTIVSRKRKDGSTAYMAQIVIMKGGKHVRRETKTFDRRPVASAWITKREKELAKPGALEAAKADKRNPTLADAITRYTSESEREIGRTKAQVLRSIKSYEIADKICPDISSVDIVEFAKQKLDEGVGPSTSTSSAYAGRCDLPRLGRHGTPLAERAGGSHLQRQPA